MFLYLLVYESNWGKRIIKNYNYQLPYRNFNSLQIRNNDFVIRDKDTSFDVPFEIVSTFYSF